jgi:2-polyprenyl-6-methoxyphenol hydroxylase-like FAD-dependent oxidoreductase
MLDAVTRVDLLVAGLGPGGCATALAARMAGLNTLAVEPRGLAATRSRLILIRPAAREALRQIGLPDITEGRRTTTIQHVETQLRAAVVAAAGQATERPLRLGWHHKVTALEMQGDHVLASLLDESSGQVQRVAARHLVDASGGRLETLGRPARLRMGPSHHVISAQYAAPPWFEGIVGVRDPLRHEFYLLFPTWGRQGVIAYFDAPPGRPVDTDALLERFEGVAQNLGLGAPSQPASTYDVYQRGLQRPCSDRVVPIGDSVGTVDALLGAGLSMSIEDAVDAARGIAKAQAETTPQREGATIAELGARIHARHRAGMRQGRLLLLTRPLLERAWPKATLPDVTRASVGPPPLLWATIRLVFGRKPQPPERAT